MPTTYSHMVVLNHRKAEHMKRLCAQGEKKKNSVINNELKISTSLSL